RSNILPISEKRLYGLNKLFPKSFSVLDIRVMNDTPKYSKYWMSWSVKSSSFSCKAHVDHRQDGSPSITRCWSYKGIVVIGWSDVESIYENVFVKIARIVEDAVKALKKLVFFSRATTIGKIGFL
ncbi:hypothetical protein Tco_0049133, partial [Tanacetum coccineum]